MKIILKTVFINLIVLITNQVSAQSYDMILDDQFDLITKTHSSLLWIPGVKSIKAIKYQYYQDSKNLQPVKGDSTMVYDMSKKTDGSYQATQNFYYGTTSYKNLIKFDKDGNLNEILVYNSEKNLEKRIEFEIQVWLDTTTTKSIKIFRKEYGNLENDRGKNEKTYKFEFNKNSFIEYEDESPYIEPYKYYYKYNQDSTISSKSNISGKHKFKYGYNYKKDKVYEIVTHNLTKSGFNPEYDIYEDSWEYEYDDRGNWIRRIHKMKNKNTNDFWIYMGLTERKIIYE
jgi:uncharacterized protein with FMN-binding domain